MNSESRPEVLISSNEIAATVDRLAAEIRRDYLGKDPLLLGILKGSFMFMADLIRLLDFPLEVEFVRLSSYGRGTESSGKMNVVQGLRSTVKGRDVLVVEDIVDTGLTVAYLMEYLSKKRPALLKLCALLDKPSRRRVPVSIDYIGITVPDKFLVGYGLDCDEKYRNLPDVCILEGE
ncbi:MAG TPA: hypoxanthine phosphoribosyltransferase [Dehalococcoidia bacterium]|nr:hypoxanthine phosphoribosyltransferase [Dehalococcoidia bacterium]